MTQELFVFVKSFKDRLDEFNNILNSNLSVYDTKKCWSNFIEFSVEPVGWRAIWKVSRDLCRDLKIEYPYTVIVTVHDVNFKELSCTVSINEVEDGSICLPPMMADIPLIELYPTIQQDNNCVLSRLYETATIIDNLRFFYNHLWMPWDLDCDEGNYWVVSHLEGRLNLHFALVERKVPKEIAYTIRKLVIKGRKIEKEIEDIQDQLSEEMEVDGFSSRLLELTELHNHMTTLRDRYGIYEKPELLKALVKRVQSNEKTQLEKENCESVIYMVLTSSTPEQLSRLAKMTSESKCLRLYQKLQKTLVKAPANASVWVAQGKHPVHDLGNLEVGGSIRGVEHGVVLTEEAESPSSWSLLRGSLSLTNLTVHMSSVWNIIKVRPEAKCLLQEVRLEGTSVMDAVDVFPGANLVANNCHFSKCRTAVVCDTNCSVVLTNCIFTNNKVAIEIKEGCNFTMENCTISDSQLYGINIAVVSQVKNNSVDSINSIPGLKEFGTIFKNNAMDCHFDATSLKHEDNESSNSDILSASR